MRCSCQAENYPPDSCRCSLFIFGAAGSLILLVVILLFFRISPYPELAEFQMRQYSHELYDRNGSLIKVLPLKGGLRRIYRKLDEIPDTVERVFITAEDSRFYFHPGVDPVAVFRAYLQNRSAKTVVSGASTITMQLAGMMSGGNGGYSGKIKEAFNALRLESHLSKKEILELWLNNIPFGFQVEGVAAASMKFLSRDISASSLESSILMAVIPRSPGMLNPVRNRDAAVKAALRFGENSGLLKNSERKGRSIDENILQKELNSNQDFLWPDTAPHFSLLVEEYSNPGKESSPSTDQPDIGQPDIGRLNTYRTDTSLDLQLNEILVERINHYIYLASDSRITNGAGIIVDNMSGEILAYIGSSDFNDKANNGEIDGVRILNQPGSTLKPFLYALAIEKGFRPNSVLPDIPLQLGGHEAYLPMNFNRSFHGPVLLRVALASSMNVPAVYMINRLGVRNFALFLISLGFESIRSQIDQVGTGLALGNAEVSLMELAEAFSVFPRGGIYLPLTPYSGKAASYSNRAENQSGGTKIMEPYTAGIICNILNDDNSRFPGFGSQSIMNRPYDVMFKTGTANQFQNIWALGATTNYTVAVWMGNFSGNTVIGRTGSSLPASVVVDMLDLLHVPGSEFGAVPDSLPVELCTLSGLRPNKYTPSTYTEFLPPNEAVIISNWHTQDTDTGAVLAVYPEEYRAWLAEKDRSGRTGSPANYPEITFPVDGSVFFVDPGVPVSDQKLEISASGFSGNGISVYINGLKSAELDEPVYYFELRKGTWEIKFENNLEVDSIIITVR